ncbi:DUF2730 family protein [Agarivorans sp. B2Z047]|uniref:DUF2730 family protein n=1 Tax=Agarivorans sp. B2Z047 TaxID=2652721 RepID=UPI00128C7A12|nr:DUF2730 family protein [Agarivorans sp. B2Z047]MPW30474.1 DUF2730 family protein [Agarivorans sp. B2Z047]UQN42306.1 DUF2730 domain-containing protein [Agarivorans sp. B2Z047]
MFTELVNAVGAQTLWAAFVASVALTAAIVNLWLSSRFARKRELDDINKRVTSIEHQMERLPDKDEMHALKIEVEQLRGDIKGFAGEIRPLAHQLSLLFEKELKE